MRLILFSLILGALLSLCSCSSVPQATTYNGSGETPYNGLTIKEDPFEAALHKGETPQEALSRELDQLEASERERLETELRAEQAELRALKERLRGCAAQLAVYGNYDSPNSYLSCEDSRTEFSKILESIRETASKLLPLYEKQAEKEKSSSRD